MAGDRVSVKRALVSVSDKAGLVPFVRRLAAAGVEILSTGGTASALRDAGVPVTAVESYTGHPEIMDGRVKTLHPRVHGAILAVRDNEQHMRQAHEHGIVPIDMVVVNLYPFEKTVAKPDVTLAEAIENIDIGGPAMVRSAAKNHRYVAIVVDPSDYEAVADEVESGGMSQATRERLAVKAYRHTAKYDTAITAYLAKAYHVGR
jgi:phosphoribosylaminoimidazolecarboxamide formyltransferase/IMP cyclohydrolase